MQTSASFVRSLLVAAAAVAAVACAGPSTGPTSRPQPSGGGSTGTGGGGSTGTGGNGGNTPAPAADLGTTTTTPDGGTTASGVGCNSYVACLANAMSQAEATACDNAASANAKNILDAEDTCVANYCMGMTGATARCKAAADGSPENLDGTPPFDATTGAPSGNCGPCLVNGEAGLFGHACQPTSDPACDTSACTQQVAACRADG